MRRGAWLEIDLDALRHNVGVIGELAGPAAEVAPVVKADAYGHGVAVVGPALGDIVDALCVATLDEALGLRASGFKGRIVQLYPVPADGVGDALEAHIELSLMSQADLANVGLVTGTAGQAMRVQLAVDTGMSRGGLSSAGLVAVARALRDMPAIEPAGIWTHLHSATEASASAAQVRRFEAAIEGLHAASVDVPPRHIAASVGLFDGTAPALEMVRPGLAVYGVLGDGATPGETSAAAERLRPAMSLKATAVAFSDVPRGGSVGYGGQWRAGQPSRVAILPLGYGDGYARGSQPGAEVLLRGRRFPVVGVVSMDAIAVDVTAEVDVGYRDEFVLMGHQEGAEIAAGELARRRNTIAWEVLSSMHPRLARVYHSSAGEDLGR
jgi:alanine racemase